MNFKKRWKLLPSLLKILIPINISALSVFFIYHSYYPDDEFALLTILSIHVMLLIFFMLKERR